MQVLHYHVHIKMKQLVIILSLLVLSLPSEGASTHLQSCDCNEIKESVVQLEDKVDVLIEKGNERISTDSSIVGSHSQEYFATNARLARPPPPSILRPSPTEHL